jgi:hypothetical protein
MDMHWRECMAREYSRSDINASALAQMHGGLTHPDIASLVDPLSGKPERG